MSSTRRTGTSGPPSTARTGYYDLAGFLAGANPLREVELALCGDVAGKDLLHLQCHFGLDTLGWARLGARATGLDFSPAAIRRARDLARQVQLPASFVEADVLDPPVDLARPVGPGGCHLRHLHLGDLDAWMRTAAGALRPGGWLIVADMHPLVQMIESVDPLVADFPYADDGPHRCTSSGTYADPSAVLSATETVQWAHSVGEITTALCRSGLRLDRLGEHLSSDRADCPGVLEHDRDGRRRLRLWDQDLPVLPSLAARKTGDVDL